MLWVSGRVVARKYMWQSVRRLTLSCWKCGTQVVSNSIFCPSKTCEAIQSVEIGNKDLNLFALLGVVPKIDVDMKELEKNYKSLQSKLHPDKFATKSLQERQGSSVTSSTINQAYQILKCPTSRVEYLLKLLCGIDLGDETQRNHQDPQLNMEIFELRETIQETVSAAELNDIKTKVIALINKYSGQFHSSVSNKNNPADCDGSGCCDDCHTAHSCATRLKYYAKILEELEVAATNIEPHK